MRPSRTTADTAGSRYVALQRLARTRGRATAELLQLYVLETFLRRLVRSTHAQSFVLKDGVLMAAFDMRRATRDVDLLALRTDNELAGIAELMRQIASVDVDDGARAAGNSRTGGPGLCAGAVRAR